MERNYTPPHPTSPPASIFFWKLLFTNLFSLKFLCYFLEGAKNVNCCYYSIVWFYMDKISFIKEKEILKLQKYFIEMKICKQKMKKKKKKNVFPCHKCSWSKSVKWKCTSKFENKATVKIYMPKIKFSFFTSSFLRYPLIIFWNELQIKFKSAMHGKITFC